MELFKRLAHPPPPYDYIVGMQVAYDKNGDGHLNEKEFKKLAKAICKFSSKKKKK